MNRIAHISNLQFGSAGKTMQNQLLESLTEQQPELVIISGDLTRRAKCDEFSEAADFLAKLKTPCLCVPGNHDLAAFNLLERFLYPWKTWRLLIDSDLEPQKSTPDYVVIGINTARRWAGLFDWNQGKISRRQARGVCAALQEKSVAQLRLLVAHHPFWLPARYHHRHLIKGRDMAVSRLSRAGIDVILSGHIHRAYNHVLDGIIISNAGGIGFSDHLQRSQTSSYTLLAGDRRYLSIEQLNWNGTTLFRSEKTSYFRRGQNGWTETATGP